MGQEIAIQDPAEIIETLEELTATSQILNEHIKLACEAAKDLLHGKWYQIAARAPRKAKVIYQNLMEALTDLTTLNTLGQKLLTAFQKQTVLVRVQEPGGIIVPPSPGS